MPLSEKLLWIFSWVYLGFQLLGGLSALRAIWTGRTAQGATAWVVALITFPLLAVPLFWVFGRNKFNGYVRARQSKDVKLIKLSHQATQGIEPYVLRLGDDVGNARVLERLTRMPFLHGNETRLLIDGDATMEAILAGIARAKEYVIVQFYIIRADAIGRRFSEALLERARAGVRVYLLYDEIGCSSTTAKYFREMEEAGVVVSGFKTTRGPANRFQINFRNHRKIVVVDGVQGWIGGLNIGDEYLSRHKKLTPWRDTHMEITGPAALGLQLAFLEDWHWATDDVPPLNWTPQPSADSDKVVFVLPTGPADAHESCGLFFTHAINAATERVWIATPYFVPDQSVIVSLQLAALRGVDVRIIIPEMNDSLLPGLAAMAYVETLAQEGVQFYQYQAGFMHQKVMLVDDSVSMVSTANFDNRSFRLNFEISALTFQTEFARDLAEMLENDMQRSVKLHPADVVGAPFWRRLGSRIARLFAPLL